jgi:hypothetical protein
VKIGRGAESSLDFASHLPRALAWSFLDATLPDSVLDPYLHVSHVDSSDIYLSICLSHSLTSTQSHPTPPPSHHASRFTG